MTDHCHAAIFYDPGPPAAGGHTHYCPHVQGDPADVAATIQAWIEQGHGARVLVRSTDQLGRPNVATLVPWEVDKTGTLSPPEGYMARLALQVDRNRARSGAG